MAALHLAISTAYVDPASREVVIQADGRDVMRLNPSQAMWHLARVAEAMAMAKLLSTAAVRSGCASDGEGAPPSSPDLT